MGNYDQAAAEILAGENWPQAEQIQYWVGRILLNLQRGTAREVVRGELSCEGKKRNQAIETLGSYPQDG